MWGLDLVGDVVVVPAGGSAGDHLADEAGKEQEDAEDDGHKRQDLGR